MAQIFHRLGRLIKSELNSVSSLKNNSDGNKLQQLSLMNGGAVTSTSLGQVGILARGGGFALGTLPLAIVGGLTGLALYEAIQIFLNEDYSSLGGGVTGAITGASLSCS